MLIYTMCDTFKAGNEEHLNWPSTTGKLLTVSEQLMQLQQQVQVRCPATWEQKMQAEVEWSTSFIFIQCLNPTFKFIFPIKELVTVQNEAFSPPKPITIVKAKDAWHYAEAEWLVRTASVRCSFTHKERRTHSTNSWMFLRDPDTSGTVETWHILWIYLCSVSRSTDALSHGLQGIKEKFWSLCQGYVMVAPLLQTFNHLFHGSKSFGHWCFSPHLLCESELEPYSSISHKACHSWHLLSEHVKLSMRTKTVMAFMINSSYEHTLNYRGT